MFCKVFDIDNDDITYENESRHLDQHGRTGRPVLRGPGLAIIAAPWSFCLCTGGRHLEVYGICENDESRRYIPMEVKNLRWAACYCGPLAFNRIAGHKAYKSDIWCAKRLEILIGLVEGFLICYPVLHASSRFFKVQDWVVDVYPSTNLQLNFSVPAVQKPATCYSLALASRHSGHWSSDRFG